MTTDNNPPNPPLKLDLFEAIAKPPPPAIDRSLLMPFSELVEKLTDYPKQVADEQTGSWMTIEEMYLNLPVEIKVVVDATGKTEVKGAPPTQLTKTTVMPTFHQLKLRIVREEDD